MKLPKLNQKKIMSGYMATLKLIKFMQNIFKNLDANAPSHMNAFDLSQRHIMSTKVGLKNVVCAIDTMPKDYFEFDFLSLIRSMPLNTAAFSRMKADFEAVFVPYQQLWHGWNQFYLQKEENMSTGDSFSHDALPYVSLSSIREILSDCCLHDALVDSLRKRVNDYPLLTDSIIDTVASTVYITFSKSLYFYSCYDEMGYSRGQNMLRFLDQLGYGSYYAVYNSALKELVDTFNGASIVTDSSNNIIVNDTVQNLKNAYNADHNYYFPVFNGDFNDIFIQELQEEDILYEDFSRLFSVFFDVKLVGSNLQFTPLDVSLNPFRALAYQKAYQDFTLNKRQEPYDPSYFNVDAHSEISDAPTITKIFSFRYESWDYDLYTGVFNSPQTGDVSILNNNVSLFFKSEFGSPHTGQHYVGTLETTALDAGKEYQLGIRTIDGNDKYFNPSDFVVKPAVSVYDIKRAEFLQRWKENHLRAGNKLQNQALGQWNTRFRYLSDEYSDYIASWDMNINIDEVINTANNQGDISGKGIGTSNGHFTYRTNDAGVILIFVSIKPRAEYDALMIDKQNTCLEIGDYPSPFFDNLGFESIPMYLLSLFNGSSTSRTTSLGYSVRYAPWKTAIDKIHGSLMSYGYGESLAPGSLSIWSTPRKEIESIDFADDISRIFYVNPNVVDSIFGFSAGDDMETDHFILNCNVLCKVVRNLSVSGQLMFGV